MSCAARALCFLKGAGLKRYRQKCPRTFNLHAVKSHALHFLIPAYSNVHLFTGSVCFYGTGGADDLSLLDPHLLK